MERLPFMFIPPCKCSFWVCVCSLCWRNIASHFFGIYYTKKSRDLAVFAVDHGSITVLFGNQVIRSQTVVGYGSVCTDLPHTSRQPRTWTVLLSLAVANKKYLNHYKIPPSMPWFAPFCKVFCVFHSVHIPCRHLQNRQNRAKCSLMYDSVVVK